MGYQFSLDDVEFLRSDEGKKALAACGGFELTRASLLADNSAAREIVGRRYAGAVLETVLLRRRAAAKIADPGGWLFTDEALQQATPWPVAAYRAQRLAGSDVHDVTCSIGADLAALARVAVRCLGSDLDAVRLAMARHNCQQAGVCPAVVRADALRPVTRTGVVVADPSRRDSRGRRTWRLNDFVPPLDALAAAYAGRDLVVKCSPGIDTTLLPWAGEVELVSLEGQAREACLWSGSLATVSRRATMLHADGPPQTVTDADPDETTVRTAGEWIVEPDPAVIRAGLVRNYAARHGLDQLDSRIAYLTGDTPPPGVRAFRVLEHGKYSEKALRQALRRMDVGRVEILVRGLDVDPSTLRTRLKLRGTGEASVVLTRIGTTPTAFICRAERS